MRAIKKKRGEGGRWEEEKRKERRGRWAKGIAGNAEEEQIFFRHRNATFSSFSSFSNNFYDPIFIANFIASEYSNINFDFILIFQN